MIYLADYDRLNILYLPTFKILISIEIKLLDKEDKAQTSFMKTLYDPIQSWKIDTINHIFITCVKYTYEYFLEDGLIKNINKVPIQQQKQLQQTYIQHPTIIKISPELKITLIYNPQIENVQLIQEQNSFEIQQSKSPFMSINNWKQFNNIVIILTNYNQIYRLNLQQQTLTEFHVKDFLRFKQTIFKGEIDDQYIQPFDLIIIDNKLKLLINKLNTGQVSDKLMFCVECQQLLQ